MFIRFSPPSFVCVRHNQQGHLAFRTTRVEDTHLTLAAIPFYERVNSFLFFYGYKICQIFVPEGFTIPCTITPLLFTFSFQLITSEFSFAGIQYNNHFKYDFCTNFKYGFVQIGIPTPTATVIKH